VSEELHSGLHPDADVLNAFLEGVLPEHERVVCLTHLAECAQCREVVSLAGHAAAEPLVVVEVRVPFWRRLFRPLPMVAVVVTAIMVTFTIGLYRMIRSAEPKPQVTASAVKPVETSPAPIPATQAAPEPAPVRAKAKPRAIVVEPEPQPAVPAALPPPPPAPAPAAASMRALAPATAVVGTVMDRAGAVIPNAQVELKNEKTGMAVASRSNAQGVFTIAGLMPGKYEESVTAPGFKKFVRPFVEVQPQETARVDSILEVGASAETVTVTAEAPLLKTESGEISHQVDYRSAADLPLVTPSRTALLPLPAYTLPGNSKPVSFVVKGKTVVAADAMGALFLSDDEGKNWQPVKGKWKGKVVRVVSPANVPGHADAVFQITTDPASTWVSADGRKWSKVR
jgi:hypothetical protein